MEKRTIFKLIATGVGGYLLHFPLRLLEDWIMGLIETEVANNWQIFIRFVIEWIMPFVVAFGLIYIGYRVRIPAILIAKQKKGALGKKGFSIVWVRKNAFFLRGNTGAVYLYKGQEKEGKTLVLEGRISINTLRRIQLESLKLDIGGQLLISDWESREFTTSKDWDARFDIPSDIQRGKRTAKLVTIIDSFEDYWESFMIDLPK